MNTRPPTLIEILQPRLFAAHPKRTEVTRTIRQPEIDEIERMELALAGSKAALPTETVVRRW